MRRKIGRIRAALPDVLVKAFADKGLTAEFEAEDLRPATGSWRTDFRLDVYRWEGQGRLFFPDDGIWLPITVDSYCTMTDCVRYGVSVERDSRGTVTQYDAYALG